MEENAMKIVVIGGTGLIGSMAVQKLKQRDHGVVAAAPNTGGGGLMGLRGDSQDPTKMVSAAGEKPLATLRQ